MIFFKNYLKRNPLHLKHVYIYIELKNEEKNNNNNVYVKLPGSVLKIAYLWLMFIN